MNDSVSKKIKKLEAWAEKAYDEMYEAKSPVGAGAYFSEVKEALYEAINLARKIGCEDEAQRLEKRFEHIRKVYESQILP